MVIYLCRLELNKFKVHIFGIKINFRSVLLFLGFLQFRLKPETKTQGANCFLKGRWFVSWMVFASFFELLQVFRKFFKFLQIFLILQIFKIVANLSNLCNFFKVLQIFQIFAIFSKFCKFFKFLQIFKIFQFFANYSNFYQYAEILLKVFVIYHENSINFIDNII